MADGPIVSPNINQNYILGQGQGYHDPDSMVLKLGDGITPWKDLPNLYQFAQPPKDDIVYGVMNGAYEPIVWADTAIQEVHVVPDPLTFAI